MQGRYFQSWAYHVYGSNKKKESQVRLFGRVSKWNGSADDRKIQSKKEQKVSIKPGRKVDQKKSWWEEKVLPQKPI